MQAKRIKLDLHLTLGCQRFNTLQVKWQGPLNTPLSLTSEAVHTSFKPPLAWSLLWSVLTLSLLMFYKRQEREQQVRLVVTIHSMIAFLQTHPTHNFSLLGISCPENNNKSNTAKYKNLLYLTLCGRVSDDRILWPHWAYHIRVCGF